MGVLTRQRRWGRDRNSIEPSAFGSRWNVCCHLLKAVQELGTVVTDQVRGLRDALADGLEDKCRSASLIVRRYIKTSSCRDTNFH